MEIFKFFISTKDGFVGHASSGGTLQRYGKFLTDPRRREREREIFEVNCTDPVAKTVPNDRILMRPVLYDHQAAYRSNGVRRQPNVKDDIEHKTMQE